MRVKITVFIEVDQAAIVADNPPENIMQAIADEVRSHLEDSSVRGAVGIQAVGAINVVPFEG